MNLLPKAIRLPVGVFVGSMLTVASGVGQSAPAEPPAVCVGDDRVLRLADAGECRRGEARLSLGSGAPDAPERDGASVRRISGSPAAQPLASVVSPNGLSSIEVEDDGITLSSGGVELLLANQSLSIRVPASLTVAVGTDAQFDAGTNVRFTAGTNVAVLANREVDITAADRIQLSAAVIQQN
jgi:hypothetical protein